MTEVQASLIKPADGKAQKIPDSMKLRLGLSDHRVGFFIELI